MTNAPLAPAQSSNRRYKQMNSTKRYVTFSKKTHQKEGVIKSRSKFATRSEAREWKRQQTSPTNWGIYDVVTGQVVR